jgi:glycosyltransferase involved in cell wall biosynthesis
VEPLVSILIPAYNAERWIADTIRSAMAQTWPNKEIIVVDDGSKDHTFTAAKQFASKHVSVISQKNQGAATARNNAYSLCQGDYIQWLDADDLLAPDKLEKQLQASQRSVNDPNLLSSAWGHFIFRPHRAIFNPTALWANLTPMQWVLHNLGEGLWMQPANWLVGRKISQAAGPWDSRLTLDDDGEYFSRVVLASEGVRFVPEAKMYYRRTPSSLSYIGRATQKLDSLFLSLRLQTEHVCAIENSPRTREACVKCLQNYLVWFHPERPDLVAKSEQLAAELGGKLQDPQLPPKYAWIQKVFGWRAAKRTQATYNHMKLSLLRSWDKALSRFEARQPVKCAACSGGK